MDFVNLRTLEEATYLLSLSDQNYFQFDGWAFVGALAVAPKTRTEWQENYTYK